MEGKKKRLVLERRKKEERSLLKGCFKNDFFSFVPFEIWRDIVYFTNPKSITLLAQTCWGFKELVENAGENNLSLALSFRREEQIDLAKKYLRICAENGNSSAIFRIGFSYSEGGWGFKRSAKKSRAWFEKSAAGGNAAGMVFLSRSFLQEDCLMTQSRLEEVAALQKKALSSSDAFALANCYLFGYGTAKDKVKAFTLFNVLSEAGDEFSQCCLAACFGSGCGTKMDADKAFYWYAKAAEQGFASAQAGLAQCYQLGRGCEVDFVKAIMWYKKGGNQGNDRCKRVLFSRRRKKKKDSENK